MTYAMTEKRIEADKKRADWKKRYKIFVLRNKGYSFGQIAKHFDCSSQNVANLYNKIADMDVRELEKHLKEHE